MSTRRLKVSYRIHSPIVLTREWGITPDSVLTHEEIITILSEVHDVDRDKVELLMTHTYHKIETLPLPKEE